MRRVVAAVLLPLALAAGALDVDLARQQSLIRLVRQDCGACHGMRLTGGLGPALTPGALSDKPVEAMTAAIVHGRPGTPMPPWRAMLSEDEARWIAKRLSQGFPEEERVAR